MVEPQTDIAFISAGRGSTASLTGSLFTALYESPGGEGREELWFTIAMPTGNCISTLQRRKLRFMEVKQLNTEILFRVTQLMSTGVGVKPETI